MMIDARTYLSSPESTLHIGSISNKQLFTMFILPKLEKYFTIKESYSTGEKESGTYPVECQIYSWNMADNKYEDN